MTLTLSIAALLAFTGWSLFLLVFFGHWRIWQVVAHRVHPASFPAGKDHDGPAWYHRASRAHMNSL